MRHIGEATFHLFLAALVACAVAKSRNLGVTNRLRIEFMLRVSVV